MKYPIGYPIGIQNFGEVRRDGYAYVDKTALMYKMVSEGKYYFLSRPRRFGKSLLLSTLEAYFEGQKELFKGLAVSRLEKEWQTYPILHLDLNSREYKDEASLEAELNRHLEAWEKQYGSEYKDRATEERFIHVINNAFEQTGRRVVILVDEYDKPLLQTIGNEELQTAYRNKLKAFYSVLKTLDAKIRFAFLTGVTKFGKVSVFSDLNNLFDLSFDQRYTELCGITEKEIHEYFDESVGLLAEQNNMTKEELSTDTLNCIDIMDENPLPLLYQSGYLTLKNYDSEFDSYQLGFPNREVEQGFIKYLLPKVQEN